MNNPTRLYCPSCGKLLYELAVTYVLESEPMEFNLKKIICRNCNTDVGKILGIGSNTLVNYDIAKDTTEINTKLVELLVGKNVMAPLYPGATLEIHYIQPVDDKHTQYNLSIDDTECRRGFYGNFNVIIDNNFQTVEVIESDAGHAINPMYRDIENMYEVDFKTIKENLDKLGLNSINTRFKEYILPRYTNKQLIKLNSDKNDEYSYLALCTKNSEEDDIGVIDYILVYKNGNTVKIYDNIQGKLDKITKEVNKNNKFKVNMQMLDM